MMDCLLGLNLYQLIPFVQSKPNISYKLALQIWYYYIGTISVLKNEGGTIRGDLFEQFLHEFLWMKLFGGDDALFNFWSQVRSVYKIM